MKKQKKNKRRPSFSKSGKAPRTPKEKLKPKNIMSEPQINIMLGKGNDHVSRNELDQAESIYLRLQSCAPNHAGVQNMLGVVAMQRGKNEVAAKYFQAAQSLDINVADYPFNLSLALLNVGDAQGAEEASRSALMIRPDYVEAWNMLGLSFKMRENWLMASEAFKKALNINPRYSTAWINQSGTLTELGHLDEALVAGTNAVRYGPEFAESHYNLACVLQAYGKDDDAINKFQEALAISPDYADAYVNLSLSKINLGKYDDSISIAQHAIAIDPRNYSAYVNLGLAFCHKGEYRDGVFYYKQALEFVPEKF